MTSLAERFAQDQRLIVLDALNRASGCTLNETILMKSLNDFGHRVGRDVVRTIAAWLEEQGLVQIDRLTTTHNGEFWVVKLAQAGEEIITVGRAHPGVARRMPA